MILPALTEAKSPFFRPIKYSLFPPLGLATLAAYLSPEDRIVIQDEHVETLASQLDQEDRPDVVVLQVYITSASRAYEIADHYRLKGCHVCLGGLHVTSLPGEALQHADTIFLGPGEDTWPAFLADYRLGHPGSMYRSKNRSLLGAPHPRRDLIKQHLYLVPNTMVVSRGCPHHCDFCYKDAFYTGGPSFYTQSVDRALEEIDSLGGRHLYFLDDHLFGSPRFASALFQGMRGMGRIWQAAGTVASILQPGLLEQAAASGLRSLFVGFETLNPANLQAQHKVQNLHRDYTTAIHKLHDQGVMVNASFVFGMDEDDSSVFSRTVEWAIRQGIETATFHILTPYPGTPLYKRMQAANRMLTADWDLYDTRHAVFQPAKMNPQELEEGYRRAYQEFYSWKSIFQAAGQHDLLPDRFRHLLYSAGWKKFEPAWNWVIQLKRLIHFRSLLETILSGGPQTTSIEESFSLADVASAQVIAPIAAALTVGGSVTPHTVDDLHAG